MNECLSKSKFQSLCNYSLYLSDNGCLSLVEFLGLGIGSLKLYFLLFNFLEFISLGNPLKS